MTAGQSIVCVIGAGPSGLIAVKELLEAGHRVVCYEKSGAVGGVFNPSADGMSYDSLRLTVSNYFMAYSCFPPLDGEERKYWTGDEYRNYLDRFIEQFGLRKHIRLNTSVRRIRKISADRFIATLADAEGVREETFGAVAVCTGANHVPHRPRFKGEDSFAGTIEHTSSYSNPSGYAGKHVVCVGIGESSADIVREMSEAAASCVLSFRRYPAILQRYPFGRCHPGDAYSTRLAHSVPRTWHSRRAARLAEMFLQEPESVDPIRRVIYEWRLRSGGSGNQFLMKNDGFIGHIVDGRIRVIPHSVDRLEGGYVLYEDGSRVAADVVMCCTGYSAKIDIVEGVEIEDTRSLYKHTFHPKLGPRIGFIGWARPAQGGIPACSEMQSRYFALLVSGERELPQIDTLMESIERERKNEEAMFHVQPHVTTLVHYTQYMDSLAEVIGCRIRKRAVVWRPRLFFHLLCGSNVAATYRLFGPGSQFASAKRLILSLPVAWPISDLVRFSLWWVAARLLSLAAAKVTP